METTRHAYGEHPSQFAELTRPSGSSRGVVVLIHGGFWRAAYGLDQSRPLAEDLARRGWTVWNLEYRRVGDGGGVPETPEDVATAIDRLAEVAPDVDLSTVITLGHSAGGHLAVWAAGRPDPGVRVTGAVSQGGVVDLLGADRANLGDGAVPDFLGHPATEADARWDPLQQVPLAVPVRCVHAPDDDIVPIDQSERYVERAAAQGADAALTVVDGGHFGVIDVSTPAWTACVDAVEELSAR
ncbi:alpha/beta hydrolase [Nocardioides rotundus]|uniref:alpha/beta hydrolase family protein n=1 Tax=Nocardioides rotundus TaxID=1774216 RepID=UPI001CBFF9B2|nr:alpha/beta hydrolase [Nocardioides rotundus]UAL29214.1 alpha/beta hydrolase [Nocardioides rotundus]